MLEHTSYHRALRVFAVVLALVLVFDSGLLLHATKQLSSDTQDYLATAIGMSASVEPTELNQITAELTAQKRSLEEREAALREREIQVGIRNDGGSAADYSTYILSGILFILLVLIVLNYTLDYLRAREEKTLTA